MRKPRNANCLFFSLALALHLALIAGAYVWHERTLVQASPLPLTVSLTVPAAPAPAEPPSVAPAPTQAKRTPKRERARPKAPAKPQAAPKQAAAPASKPAEPPSPQDPTNPAAVSEPAPEAAPAVQAQAKTDVSVNASYVATETAKWYPGLSKRYGEQGTVVVRVYVSADGRAERVELRKRSDYPLLDEAAIGLARSLKYNPATVGGNPVADWVDIPITFRLRNP